jgi:DNA polymerase-1
VGSFITPLIDTHNQNGRVHPLLNQSKGDESGVIGGRLSCQDPNMQAFPKRNKVVGKVVRQLIIPDFGELSEADFKQQEPRLFAHFSEDRNLLAAYLADPPLDIHDVSSSILSLPRDVSKRLGLGILTGMGYQALADHMGWTFDEAKRAHNTFLGDAFPGIKDFQTDAKKTMISRGYVRTLLGRRCTVDDNRYAYKAVSRIIQGSGADHTKTALLIACEYCESESDNIDLLMTIHDSFISQHTDRKYRDELSALLANVATKMGVMIPIPVEVGTGSNWSEASYGK